ncbi:DUF3080 domain-containing protein [Pseudoalteromonas sp. JBTF-M23]|uniref:DUF3080 domain-containing protein n=1 Tax=Pseudoalteromonas caenipelagi TaxID=2726988 RepID=A0A849V8P5_9GAMM|nr:DUF3080 family protein [Pseudoalteromonas caenipelagi]NOU49298.1 DUF3080 domain-containing protein [Pseudoalteromonas caenipelagi]
MRLSYLVVSCFVLLTGCTPAPSDIYEEYQRRLENVTLKNGILDNALTPLKFKHVKKPKSQVTLSVLELTRLDHCALMNIIAANNNQLGKVRVPSEQLKYAINFIVHAQHCLNHPETIDDTVKAKLATALEEKKSQLTKYFEQMVFNERELSKMLLLTSQEIALEDHQDPLTKALEALTTLTHLYTKIALSEPDYSQLEDPQLITDALATLNKNNSVSRLITSARKQISSNNLTTQWLNTIEPSKTFCQQNKNKKKAQILSNIFNKFYLSQLQGYQSKLTNMLREVSPLLFVLWRSEPQLSRRFNVESSDSYYQQLKHSAVQHVTWWQKFYKTCKIQP